MGNSREGTSKGIDATVGGLVWVRRRNGSWWPGRIVGLDELPETCIVSQRPGMPVKLLGREDSCVDWYNLEKSKRVKAFRCGEYDEYIEKVKARGRSNKKAAKYASRKDAILCALELESACSGALEVCVRMSNSPGAKHRNLARQPHSKLCGRDYMHKDFSNIDAYSTQEQSGTSSKQPNHVTTSQVHILQQKRQKTLNDLGNDGNGRKRMRGLQDLGSRAPSKRMSNVCFDTEGSPELGLPGSISLSESDICNYAASESPVCRASCLSLKGKCSDLTNIHEVVKKKHRHRPLAEVLESTDKVILHSACDLGASLSKSSTQGITVSKKSVAFEPTESKNTSSSMAILYNSDSSRISVMVSNNAPEHTCDAAVDATHSECLPEIKDNECSNMLKFPSTLISDSSLNMSFGKDKNGNEVFSPVFVSCGSGKLKPNTLKRQSSYCSRVCSMILNTEGSDETSSSCFANLVNCAVGFSGKVENGSAGETLAALDDCGNLDERELIPEDTGDCALRNIQVSKNWVPEEGLGRTGDVNLSGEWRSSAHSSLFCEKPAAGNSVPGVRIKGLFSIESQAVRPMPHEGSLSYLRSRFSTYSSYEIAVAPITGTTSDSPLFDVNLDVRTSYHGRHVPLVSLMSKLNGKAIVGHPITVEILEDGQCDLLMTGINCRPTIMSSELFDVPIKCTSGQMMGVVDDSLLMDGSDDGIGALQVETKFFIPKGRRNNLSSSLSFSPLSRRKLPKMRKCGFLYKKTRKLSSIIVDNDRLVEERKLVVEKGQPVVSCVPVKLVFSRIKEALSTSGRPVWHTLASPNH